MDAGIEALKKIANKGQKTKKKVKKTQDKSDLNEKPDTMAITIKLGSYYDTGGRYD